MDFLCHYFKFSFFISYLFMFPVNLCYVLQLSHNFQLFCLPVNLSQSLFSFCVSNLEVSIEGNLKEAILLLCSVLQSSLKSSSFLLLQFRSSVSFLLLFICFLPLPEFLLIYQHCSSASYMIFIDQILQFINQNDKISLKIIEVTLSYLNVVLMFILFLRMCSCC